MVYILYSESEFFCQLVFNNRSNFWFLTTIQIIYMYMYKYDMNYKLIELCVIDSQGTLQRARYKYDK